MVVTLPAKVNEMLAPFKIRPDQMQQVTDMMYTDMNKGLTSGVPTSSIPMLPSYLPSLPDGTEKGRYLSMDLSGTNLRVMLLTLSGKGHPPEKLNHNYMVPSDIMIGSDKELFDFIVGCLNRFLTEHDLKNDNLALGFVFSYPCEQIGIRESKLLWWTKGFNVSHCIGQDVVGLLEDALLRNGEIKVRVRAIMNDTVGQLALAAYLHGTDTCAGVVVSNGCNASYIEKSSNITKLSQPNYNFETMVIDTEWEEFGGKGELDFIRTSYDMEVDEASVHKGKQTIDKMTGALYLGEICRRMLDQLVVDGLLFNGVGSDKLSVVEKFPTKYISEILTDEGRTWKNTRRVLDELQIQEHNTSDYHIIMEVCRILSLRSASIVASAIAALLKLLNKPKVIIGIGGKLYEYLPMYKEMVEEQLRFVAPKGIEYSLEFVKDGSVQGAALVAAVADRMNLV